VAYNATQEAALGVLVDMHLLEVLHMLLSLLSVTNPNKTRAKESPGFPVIIHASFYCNK
jgi:hypothetical protein